MRSVNRIDLSEKTSVESREVAPGVVLDFDAEGQLVGIDIDCASQVINLSRLEAVSRLSALGRYADHPIRLIGLIG